MLIISSIVLWLSDIVLDLVYYMMRLLGLYISYIHDDYSVFVDINDD